MVQHGVAAGGGVVVSVGQVQFNRGLGFDAGVDAGFRQRLKVGLRVGLRQALLEGNRLAVEQPFDGRHFAFVQRRQIEFGGGEVDPRQQSAVEYDLETVVAHCEASLSRVFE
jgi:hypothetical protein